MSAASGYSILDHTGDVGIRAWGPTPETVFVAAAEGLFDLVCVRTGVRASETDEIVAEADGYPELLREWLAELLYRFTGEHRLYGRFEIVEMTPTRLRARALGEAVDPERHEVKTELKAVTYHQLSCERKGARWEAQVIFDV